VVTIEGAKFQRIARLAAHLVGANVSTTRNLNRRVAQVQPLAEANFWASVTSPAVVNDTWHLRACRGSSQADSTRPVARTADLYVQQAAAQGMVDTRV
jgi:hypothetical protein